MAGVIKRGEFWVVDLEPGFGREIHKKRPGLIISANNFNDITPYVIVIPTTSIVPRVTSEEIVVLGKPKGFDQKSTLLPLYIRSVDKNRLIKKVGRVSIAKMKQVEQSLKNILGLDL